MSACARMAWAVPKPDRQWLDKFRKWFTLEQVPKIREMLQKLKIDHKAWYNRLTASKQNEVMIYFKDTTTEPKRELTKEDIEHAKVYTNFVKSEKQIAGDKTRCICSPKAVYKYITGPVTYALE